MPPSESRQCLGSENKLGEPFGDWLDMQGIRWRPNPEGGWMRTD